MAQMVLKSTLLKMIAGEPIDGGQLLFLVFGLFYFFSQQPDWMRITRF